MRIVYIREYKPQQQRESSMRGNAARRDSHNVTHRYRERANRSVSTYARGRARAQMQPVSQVHYTAESRISFPDKCAPCCATTPTTTVVVSPRSYLRRRLHPFLVNARGRSAPRRLQASPSSCLRTSEVLSPIRKRAVVGPGRGNKSSNRHDSRSATPIPTRLLTMLGTRDNICLRWQSFFSLFSLLHPRHRRRRRRFVEGVTELNSALQVLI